MRRAEQLQKLFEEYLLNQKFNDQPRNLFEPFNYMLRLPAKRLRPVMALLACEAFGTDAKKALPQAFAIELFHNFTLIHDDIMDRAPLRRGKPSVHNKYGETIAILSGDAMLVFAYKYLVQANEQLVPKLLQVFNQCAIDVCRGQQFDMNFESEQNVSLSDYMKMIELKTATLIASSLKIGALVGGSNEKDSELLFLSGKELGISFQLRDDLLDVFSTSEKSGKQRGGDILQNKKTFLFLKALQVADDKTAAKLLKYYSSASASVQDRTRVNEILKIFTELKIEELTKLESENHFKKAMSLLQKAKITNERKGKLILFSKSLLNRSH